MLKKLDWFFIFFNESVILRHFIMCPKFWYDLDFPFFIPNEAVFYLYFDEYAIILNYYLEKKKVHFKW